MDSTILVYQQRIVAIADSIKETDSAAGLTIASTERSIFITQKEKSEKENFSKRVKDFIPWFIGLPGFFIAYFNFQRTSRFKNYDFLGDVNKQVIQNPQLSAFYDKKRKYYESQVTKDIYKIEISGFQKIYFKEKIDLTSLDNGVEITGNPNISINGTDILRTKILALNESICLTSKGGFQVLSISGMAKITIPNGEIVYSQADKELDHKVRAFAFYKLNNFESVLRNLSGPDGATGTTPGNDTFLIHI